MNLNNSSPLLFIIDNISLTGFAEYLVWQQQNNVNGLLISPFKAPFPMSSSVVVKSQIDPNHPKVHLLCSDVAIEPMNITINKRYMERYHKRELAISCRRALARLDEGGHFVCKIFDTLTRFTAGLIYLLYRSFKSICILRPFTLNPASPERFLVCCELKYPVDMTIIQHLDKIILNEKIDDILEVVPLKCLIEPQFQQYMADMSQRLIQREIQGLDKRLWYINHQNNQQINSITQGDWNEARRCITIPRRPKPTPIEPDSGITLPPGWTKEWSTKQKQHYYFNIHTKESVWEPPN